MIIRQAKPREFPQLAELWRRSVRATHSFLTSEQVNALYKEVRDYAFASVDLWVCERETTLVGFMGLHRTMPHVEMLFVEPAYMRQGIGSRLLDQAKAFLGTLTIDVNEQNPDALAFYQRYGFTIIGRSPVDSQGRPFPLLHLLLKA